MNCLLVCKKVGGCDGVNGCWAPKLCSSPSADPGATIVIIMAWWWWWWWWCGDGDSDGDGDGSILQGEEGDEGED